MARVFAAVVAALMAMMFTLNGCGGCELTSTATDTKCSVTGISGDCCTEWQKWYDSSAREDGWSFSATACTADDSLKLLEKENLECTVTLVTR